MVAFWSVLSGEGMNEERSRVFISCGQGSEGERTAASRIELELKDLGFEPYLAIQVQSARSLRENIFDKLRDTEYFLFLDFRREQVLTRSGKAEYRGSLFSHQELAIASFLDVEVLAFREDGVIPLDGMLGHFQVNAIPFGDRQALPELVRREMVNQGWQNRWRNQLAVRQATPPFDRVTQVGGGEGIFFHLQVTNCHRRVAARNCYGYLRSVTDVGTNEPVEFEGAEFKWAGYTLPNAVIPPRSHRKLDAIWIDPANPERPMFRAFADWSRCTPALVGPDSWELEYEVLSDNVPGCRMSVRLELGPDPRQIRFGESLLWL
jgi:hypothetical protein